MILPYGPIPLTAGIVTSQDVDSSAAWVVVENVSLFLYLGVSFWPSKPPAVTVFNGQPWNVVIQPGGTLRIPTPAQGWLGRIWLLGVDASGQSAAAGTVSSYSAALIRTYGPNDTASDSPSVVRGLDILSQPRMVDLPAGMQQWTQSQGTLPAVVGDSFFVGRINLSAANIANNIIEAYMSTFFFQMGEPAQGTAQLELDWVIRDAGAAVLASIGILEFNVYSPGVNTGPGTIIDRVWPLPLNWERSLSGLIAPVDVALRMTLLGASAGIPGAGYNVHSAWWLDLVNAFSIASPGNGVLHQAPSAHY